MRRLGVALRGGFQDGLQKALEEGDALDGLWLIQGSFPKIPSALWKENSPSGVLSLKLSF